jgi:hypothetical protein
LQDLKKLVDDIEKCNRQFSGAYLREGARYVVRTLLEELRWTGSMRSSADDHRGWDSRTARGSRM